MKSRRQDTGSARTTRSSGLGRLIGSAALAKVIVMGSSGLLAILTSRLIIQHFGVESYAQYGLLASLPTLLPFADLGIAAVVINAVAGSKEPRTDEQVTRVLVTAFRILICSGTVIVTIAAGITLLEAWPTLLGTALDAQQLNVAAFLCFLAFGMFMPLVVGQRVLVGLNRTISQIGAQAVVAPFMLLCILSLVVLAVPAASFLAVFSYVGNGLVSVICLFLAHRHLGPQLRKSIRLVPRVRSFRGAPAFGLAWPMLIQMTALPLAMQTDRLLLSHLTSGSELAQYNLAAQLFGLVLQTIAAAGVALWPFFARARADNRIESPARPTLWFTVGGLALGGALALASPLLAGFISVGQIVLDPWLVIGFVAFIGLQAAKYPIGMYMTDQRGLWFQVVPILILVPLNLGLSWWLITLIGAGGPIIGSAASVLVCQVIPNFLFVRRDLQRKRALAEQVEAGATA